MKLVWKWASLLGVFRRLLIQYLLLVLALSHLVRSVQKRHLPTWACHRLHRQTKWQLPLHSSRQPHSKLLWVASHHLLAHHLPHLARLLAGHRIHPYRPVAVCRLTPERHNRGLHHIRPRLLALRLVRRYIRRLVSH